MLNFAVFLAESYWTEEAWENGWCKNELKDLFLEEQLLERFSYGLYLAEKKQKIKELLLKLMAFILTIVFVLIISYM